MTEEKKYEYIVLKAISFKGDRVERGTILSMTEADAYNIGAEYVAPKNPIPKIDEEEDKDEDETIDHVVTQEDLDTNPALVEASTQVGDVIKLPKPIALEDMTAAELKNLAKSLELPVSGSKADLIERIKEAQSNQ